MIGPINKGNLPSIWAAASYKTALHSERTNVTQLITRSEAQAMAHNSVGPVQRTTYETPQIAPVAIGRHQASHITPDLTKQNYSALSEAKAAYYPTEHLHLNYFAQGQTARIHEQAAAGVVINRVV